MTEANDKGLLTFTLIDILRRRT